MLRRLLNLLAALSLLLTVAVTALWVRSYFVSDDIRWTSQGPRYHLKTCRGQVALQVAQSESVRPRGTLRWNVVGPRNRIWLSVRESVPQRLGFWWAAEPIHVPPGYVLADSTEWAAPWWGLAAPPGCVVMAWLMWGRRRSGTNTRSGLCVRCGYDLRATPDRCPECGAVP